MAFTQSTFAPIGPQSTLAPASFSYSTPDSIALVQAADYFAPKQNQLRQNDLIYVVAVDSNTVIAYQGPGLASITISGGPAEVLTAISQVSQAPVALDTPIQLTLGPAFGGASDPVMVDNAGLITFNQGGAYELIAIASISRTSSVGTAFLFLRALLNGVQFENPIASVLTDDDMTVPFSINFIAPLPPGTTLTFEFARDSAGINNGGLQGFTASGPLGWGTSASISVRLFKF